MFIQTCWVCSEDFAQDGLNFFNGNGHALGSLACTWLILAQSALGLQFQQDDQKLFFAIIESINVASSDLIY